MSVFGDHDTPRQRPTNAKFDNEPLMKKGEKQKGGYCKCGQSWQYTGGCQRMMATRSFLARQVVFNSVQYTQFSMGVSGAKNITPKK
jgi:hypothetical protein